MRSKISRRNFIQTTGLASAGLMFSSNSLTSQINRPVIKAIAFDAFPIFDPRPIFKKVNQLFPEKGEQLTTIWRIKQFDYQWLRVMGNKYRNFWDVTLNALDYAATACGIELAENDKNIIMSEFKMITTWPDVTHSLRLLKNGNLKLCFISNMTKEMLNWGLQNSGAQEFFDDVISTDEIKTYKPSPAAYKLGTDVLRLKKEEILFVAFAGWDVAGAKWFGYPTYWVNRFNLPMERLDAEPGGVGNDLTDLVEFIASYNKQAAFKKKDSHD